MNDILDKQLSIFERKEWWEEYWGGMPEFSQKNKPPFKTLIVHFENKEDMDNFSKIIGQKLTVKTKFIWHPEQKHRREEHFIYTENRDES